jgi:hypothetical protein
MLEGGVSTRGSGGEPMSFIFGGTNRMPAQDQRAFGISTQRANTNQQARPVPLLYGKQRLGLTFISDAFDLLAQPVVQTVGKRSQETGKNYFASFAGLACHGPVDGLHDIFLNGEPVFASTVALQAVSLTAVGAAPGLPQPTGVFQTANAHGLVDGQVVIITGADQPEYNVEVAIHVESPTQFSYTLATPATILIATWTQSGGVFARVRLDPILRDGTNPDFADVTIPDYGVMRIYWGTETQTADAYLLTASGNEHPAYLGFCYVVFQQLFFGFNQTNVPNVELVLSRNPMPTWVTEDNLPASIIDGEANPAFVFADLLQNRRAGLALEDDEIGQGGIKDVFGNFPATFNEDDPPVQTRIGIGVSRVLSRGDEARTIITELCETVDMLPVLDADFNLSLRAVIPVTIDDLPTVADENIADFPEFEPQDWSTTYPSTRLAFLNRDTDYQDDSVEWRDIGVLNVIRHTDPLTVDRPWVTNPTLAKQLAALAGQISSLPSVAGKLKLQYDDDLFAALTPGSAFLISYVHRSTENLVFRVQYRSLPGPDVPEFEIGFKADRAYLLASLEQQFPPPNVQLHYPPDPPPDPPIIPDPILVVDYNRLRLFELPPGLCPGSPALAALVARDSTASTNFKVWLKRNKVWSGAVPDSYVLLGTQDKFSMHGYVDAGYALDTRTIDLRRGMRVQFDGPDLTLPDVNAFDALSDTVLLFVDDEICSVAGWTLVGAGLYRIQLIRGRFGTPVQDHAAGTRVLVANRSDLPVLSRNDFRPTNEETFKIALGEQDISEVGPFDQTLDGVAWRVPPPCLLAVNGRTRNAVFAGGGADVSVTWKLPDPGGYLPRFDLAKLYTRLSIYKGLTADSEEITADSEMVTADGGSITEDAGELIYQTDVPHSLEASTFNFAAVTGLVDQNFLLVATTVCDEGWKQILSAVTATLQVKKFP